MTAAVLALANPMPWIVMYGAAAAAWLIHGMTPPLARLCLELQAIQRRRALDALSNAIREEWGDDAAGQQSRPAANAERDNRP